MRQEKGLSSIHELTRNFHVFPDFHGNRSPLADPEMKGALVGLDLDKSENSLALLYLATLQVRWHSADRANIMNLKYYITLK